MAEPYYSTFDTLRTELGVDNTVLTDPNALKLIQDAEDIVDELLGAWPIDPTIGRKILQSQVEAWQWLKLQRATTKLAAALYRNPDLTRGKDWKRVKGPDFEFDGPLSGVLATDVLTPLNQSALRQLAGRAVPHGPRTRFETFLNATRHDGT